MYLYTSKLYSSWSFPETQDTLSCVSAKSDSHHFASPQSHTHRQAHTKKTHTRNTHTPHRAGDVSRVALKVGGARETGPTSKK